MIVAECLGCRYQLFIKLLLKIVRNSAATDGSRCLSRSLAISSPPCQIMYTLAIVLKKLSIFECCFHRRDHSAEQTHFTRVFPSDTHFTAESTEAMRIKYLAHSHNILIKPRFKPSIAVCRNRYPTHMTSILHVYKGSLIRLTNEKRAMPCSRRSFRSASWEDLSNFMQLIVAYFLINALFWHCRSRRDGS